MHPIAILAFIMGIGNNAPAPKPRPESPTAAAGKESPAKPVPPGDHKLRRGGWDGN